MSIRPAPDQEPGKQSKNDVSPRMAPVRRRIREPQPQQNPDPVPEPAYTTGYGKPPRHGQFKPGQSGNPNGRPKGAKGLNTIVRQVMNEKLPIRTSTGERRISRIEYTVRNTDAMGKKGNLPANIFLLRQYGIAVPDVVESADEAEAVLENLTPADRKILEMYKDQIISRLGEKE